MKEAVPELGTRQHGHDNVAMFSGQKWLIIKVCLYSMCLLHLDTEASAFLFEALLRCRFAAMSQS